MRCPVVLSFITKQAKILFNFLVLVFHFAVILWMVGSSEAGLNTKALVESSHETGSKLQASIGEDLLQDSVETEYVGVVNVGSTLGCKIRFAGYKVALIRVVVDIDADRIETVQSRELGD
jgi:hypothetical protein